MARRIVCKKCGYINNPDENVCSNCEEDISVDRVSINVDKSESNHFYNYQTKEFCQKSPFSNINKKEIISEEFVEMNNSKYSRLTKYETPISKNLIKICPMCDAENPNNAEYCTECNSSLRLVKPIDIDEKQNIEQNEIIINNSKLEEESPYSLVFGVSGENVAKIRFTNNRFYIGRDFQPFLEEQHTVSRKHCYIEKNIDGSLSLSELIEAPSTNHTYVKLTGGRLIQIVPGESFTIRDGTIFYISKKIMVLIRKDI